MATRCGKSKRIPPHRRREPRPHGRTESGTRMQNRLFNPLTPYPTMQAIKSTTRDAIVDFFLDFRSYISEVFSSDTDAATLDWNSVGACIHYFGEDRTIQFRLWERSEGHLGLPDMTLIIIRISFRGTQDVIRAEMKAFIHWLKQTAKTHGFLHFADEDSQPLPTNQVPGCRIACIRL